MPDTADITISIATHNRREDLLRTCRAIAELAPAPREVIVCADGCTDGTAEAIRDQFPDITLITNQQAQGSIISRDRILQQASSPIVLSLDDDSYPVERDFLARVEQSFELDAQLAVLTCFQITDEFPLTLESPDSQRGERQMVASFPNSAAAIRRAVYLESAGYPAAFFHQYEEPDFALQCYSLGYHVVYEPELTVRHHFSPAGRREVRNHRRHARNELWSTAMRAPAILIPVVIPFRALSQMRYAAGRGIHWLVTEPLWWWSALRGLPGCLRNRRKVRIREYLRWLRLFRNPAGYQPPRPSS